MRLQHHDNLDHGSVSTIQDSPNRPRYFLYSSLFIAPSYDKATDHHGNVVKYARIE